MVGNHFHISLIPLRVVEFLGEKKFEVLEWWHPITVPLEFSELFRTTWSLADERLTACLGVCIPVAVRLNETI